MARISVAHVGHVSRIVLRGRLAAGDLKRLERACGSALQERLMPLEIDLRRLTSCDDAAGAYLERLRARGARIRGARPFSHAAEGP